MSTQQAQLEQERRAKRVKLAHRKQEVDHGYRKAMQAPEIIPATSFSVRPLIANEKQVEFEVISPHNAVCRNFRVKGSMRVQIEVNLNTNVFTPDIGESIFKRGNDFAVNDNTFHRCLQSADIEIGGRSFRYSNVQHWLTEYLRIVGSRTDNDKFVTHPNFLSMFACNNDSYLGYQHSLNTINEQSGDNIPNGAWPVYLTDRDGNEFALGAQTYDDNQDPARTTDVLNRIILATDDGGGVNARTSYSIFATIPFDEPIIFEPIQSSVLRKFQRMRLRFQLLDLTRLRQFRPLVGTYKATFVRITSIGTNIRLPLFGDDLRLEYIYDNVMPKIQKPFLYMDPNPPVFNRVTNAGLAPGDSKQFEIDVRFTIFPQDRTFLVLYAKSILENLYYSENPYRLVITNVELVMNNKPGVYLRFSQSQLFEEAVKNHNVALSFNVQKGTVFKQPVEDPDLPPNNEALGLGELQSMGSIIALALPQKEASGMQEIRCKVTVQNPRCARVPLDNDLNSEVFVPRTEQTFDLVAWTFTKQRIKNTDDMQLIKLEGVSMNEEKMVAEI